MKKSYWAEIEAIELIEDERGFDPLLDTVEDDDFPLFADCQTTDGSDAMPEVSRMKLRAC